MTVTRRKAALREWDAEIAAEYIERRQSDREVVFMPFEMTLQRGYARDLVLVIADVAVRSAEALGRSLAELDSGLMRDAALTVAVGRYLAVLPGATKRGGDNQVGERILAGLIERREPSARTSLLSLSIALPIAARQGLDAEIDRVLSGVDLADLGEWNGDLASDVRSSVIEAIVVEWMHLRAEAFGIPVGRDRAIHGQLRPRYRLRRNGAC